MLKEVEDLVNQLSKFPSVGQKTALRYALAILDMDDSEVEEMANVLVNTKKTIKFCSVCGCMTTKTPCDICLDKQRDHSVICVVSYPSDVFVIEKLGVFNGVYHVLGGLISPLRHVLVEDLSIEQLNNRVDSTIKEVILAFQHSIEGETTSLYLSKLLKDRCKVTRLAQGLPMGSKIEYADDMTLTRSLLNRTSV